MQESSEMLIVWSNAKKKINNQAYKKRKKLKFKEGIKQRLCFYKCDAINCNCARPSLGLHSANEANVTQWKLIDCFDLSHNIVQSAQTYRIGAHWISKNKKRVPSIINMVGFCVFKCANSSSSEKQWQNVRANVLS